MTDIREKEVHSSYEELLLNYNMGNVTMENLTLLLNTSKEDKMCNLHECVKKTILEIKNNKNGFIKRGNEKLLK